MLRRSRPFGTSLHAVALLGITERLVLALSSPSFGFCPLCTPLRLQLWVRHRSESQAAFALLPPLHDLPLDITVGSSHGSSSELGTEQLLHLSRQSL